MNQEIEKLLEKGLFQETDHYPDEFLSTLFLRRKPDVNHRIVMLNLKKSVNK